MRRCLFIDDSTIVRKIALRILSGPEFLVAGAETAGQALDMCTADMPDLIILDADLPDMSTAEFMARLRALPSAVAPRVLLCMVAFEIGAYMRARRAGVHGYIQKPFTRTQLLTSLHAPNKATAA